MNAQVHNFPIFIRTVIWTYGKCTKECSEEDCPIRLNACNSYDDGQACERITDILEGKDL